MKPVKINQIDIGIPCPCGDKNLENDSNFERGQKPIHTRTLLENARHRRIRNVYRIVYDYPWLELHGNASFFAEGWTVGELCHYSKGRKGGTFVLRGDTVDGKKGVRVWKRQ